MKAARRSRNWNAHNEMYRAQKREKTKQNKKRSQVEGKYKREQLKFNANKV